MIQYIKHTILTFIIIALLTTNILTLLYQPFTTAISTALVSAFGIATLTSMLSEAIDLKNIEISMHKKANAKMKRQLTSMNKALQKNQAQVRQRKLVVKNIGNRLLKRTKKLAMRTVAAVPAKSIPVIGAGVTVAGVGYEVMTMCENMRDIERLQQECGGEEPVEKGIMKAICSKVP